MNKAGVIIARFQSPYLHEGHKSLIESVRARHNKIIIVLGISPVLGSRRNPLDFPTREKMIKKEYPDLVVLPLSDHPQDAKWSQNLDSLLSNTFVGQSFILYGSRDSFIGYYAGRYEVVELAESVKLNSTAIREQISDKVMDSESFRMGVIYGCFNTYTKVYPTVDIAVFRNNRTALLLGKKDIDKKWRFPGGFTDPTDDSYEAAAARELHEECGPIEVGPMKYEGSFKMNDWRYRREEDKIITTFFSTDFISGTPVGSDDLAEVKWFTLAEVATLFQNEETAPEHVPQFTAILNKYNR
jgi:bifunctional NMN adenylyltransferase/nudix hydrolase